MFLLRVCVCGFFFFLFCFKFITFFFQISPRTPPNWVEDQNSKIQKLCQQVEELTVNEYNSLFIYLLILHHKMSSYILDLCFFVLCVDYITFVTHGMCPFESLITVVFFFCCRT